MKRLTDLDQCIHEAIEYDDNCDIGTVGTGSQTNESTTRVSSQVDEIIQGVIERMQQVYGTRKATERQMDQLYICGVCGKNHPTLQCLPKNQGGVRPKFQLALWCDFHKRWENHSTDK